MKEDRSYIMGQLFCVVESAQRLIPNYQKPFQKTWVEKEFSNMKSHPMTHILAILKKLNEEYFPLIPADKLSPYQDRIGKLLEKLDEFPKAEQNKPLGNTLMHGYYAEMKNLESVTAK